MKITKHDEYLHAREKCTRGDVRTYVAVLHDDRKKKKAKKKIRVCARARAFEVALMKQKTEEKKREKRIETIFRHVPMCSISEKWFSTAIFFCEPCTAVREGGGKKIWHSSNGKIVF